MASVRYNESQMSPSELRRSKLAGQIALYCTFFALVHFSIDFSQGLTESAAFDFIIATVIFGCFILNRLGHYRLAKILTLVLLNVCFFIYATVVPKEIGVYLFFFPLMVVSAALFGPEERKTRYGFIITPFIILVTLFLTDFHPFGSFAFDAPQGTTVFFLINIISSGFILIMCVDFMLNLHEQSEAQLKLLAEEVKAKNEDLERTNAELDRFLYSTSHDLQSPLSSIKGLINIARHDTSDAKIHTYMDKMIERVSRLEFFIKDIIDYSKNARTDVSEDEFAFDTVVEEVAEHLRYIEGAAPIALHREVQHKELVHLDKRRVLIILSNLVANAVKYHDLSKADRWIKVRFEKAGLNYIIEVADNGQGIAPEHQQKIFDMFYRGTVQSSGSGLGLFIVRQTVEKIKGTISVQSTLGVGSTFRIQLPVS